MEKHQITKTSIDGEEYIDIDKQIEFLKNQGYVISDEDKLKHTIKNYGYFRLFHNYINHWKNNNNQFKFGINEKNLLEAYYFDSNFSTLLYKYFGYFEHKLRSNIIAQGNIECPDITKQLTYFFPNKKYQRSIKEALNKHIYQGAKYLLPFRKLDIYPLFIIVNFFDLSSTLKVMIYFEDKNFILNNFYLNSEKNFYFLCNNLLRPFRNGTAHFDVMYTFNVDLYHKQQEQFNEIFKALINSDEYYHQIIDNKNYKNNTFIIVFLLCYFLGRQQSRHLIYELKKLFEKEWENKISNFNFYNDFLSNYEIMGWPLKWFEILSYVIDQKIRK